MPSLYFNSSRVSHIISVLAQFFLKYITTLTILYLLYQILQWILFFSQANTFENNVLGRCCRECIQAFPELCLNSVFYTQLSVRIVKQFQTFNFTDCRDSVQLTPRATVTPTESKSTNAVNVSVSTQLCLRNTERKFWLSSSLRIPKQSYIESSEMFMATWVQHMQDISPEKCSSKHALLLQTWIHTNMNFRRLRKAFRLQNLVHQN